jgi:hypothetical protein
MSPPPPAPTNELVSTAKFPNPAPAEGDIPSDDIVGAGSEERHIPRIALLDPPPMNDSVAPPLLPIPFDSPAPGQAVRCAGASVRRGSVAAGGEAEAMSPARAAKSSGAMGRSLMTGTGLSNK